MRMKYFLVLYTLFIIFNLQRRRKIINPIKQGSVFNDFLHYMSALEELSYDIVKANGGELKVITAENEGTEFIIQL